jgi:hypothetical protein
MNPIQIFEVCKIWIKLENLKNKSRLTGRLQRTARLHSTEVACRHSVTWPMTQTTVHGPRHGLLAVSLGPLEDRGAPASGVGAAVASWILAPAVDEVGWGRRLGQHGEMGISFAAHRRGYPHRRGLSTAVAARRRSALTLGGRSGWWHRWSG